MGEDANTARFDEIARATREADPGFVARAHRAAQFDKVTKAVIAVLLQLGTVVMTIGLAIRSIPLWLLGLAVAFLAPLFAEVQHRLGNRSRDTLDHPDH